MYFSQKSNEKYLKNDLIHELKMNFTPKYLTSKARDYGKLNFYISFKFTYNSQVLDLVSTAANDTASLALVDKKS